MKSLSRVVAMVACLLAWWSNGQNQAQGDAGLYSTPAYNGDLGGTYVSPAFSGGSFATAPGTQTAPGAPAFGGANERGARGRAGYGPENFGAYTSPAFSPPTLGLLVTPPPALRAKPKSSAGDPTSKPSGGSAPVKPSGMAEQQPESGGAHTNLLENLTAPPSLGTNAPAGQGSTGPL